MELSEIQEVVDDLNFTIWGEGDQPNTLSQFTIRYATYETSVYFDEEFIWSDQEDDRKFIEEINDYEPLEGFLIEKVKELSGNYLIVNKLLNE